jgi:hypothetical protein
MRLELEERGAVDLVGVEIGTNQRDLVARDGVSVRVILSRTRNGVQVALSLLHSVSRTKNFQSPCQTRELMIKKSEAARGTFLFHEVESTVHGYLRTTGKSEARG